MNAFQTCKDTSDIAALYLPQQLYVKPVAKLNVSLQIPNVAKVGKSISHLEIMEKLRELIKPEQFVSLKVSKSTLEFVRFEADLDNRKQIQHVVSKLDNKTVKLKNYTELMRLRAVSAKSDFPNRHVWDGFFHEAKDMNEMKPGERPDTVHFSYLPTKWFVPYHLLDEEDIIPSEKILYKIFEKFGPIRYVDVPICDPYRFKMKDHISGIKNCQWKNKDFFEAYVQFKDYIGFTKCMDFFKDMKLLHKDEDEALTADIKVDFDRTKHLSDASIRRREIVRERLVKKQMEKEEKEKNELEEKKKKEKAEKQKELDIKLQKEQRRKLREEKRKALILEKLKIKGADEINAKIAKEEKKLLKVQRKLESIRLVEELFKRIKEKKESQIGNSVNEYNFEGDKELRKYKNNSELEVLNQKTKLHNAIQGRVMLKTALRGERFNNFSSSSSDEENPKPNRRTQEETPHINGRLTDGIYEQPLWYGYPYHMQSSLYQPPIRGHPMYNAFGARGRGHYAGTSRGGYYQRGRPRGYNKSYRGGYNRGGQYPPEIEEEYIKYFSKFLYDQHDERGTTRSRSRSRRSRSRSYSRRRSYSRSRSRRRKSRSRSRKSRSRSRKSRSRSRRSSRSKSRDKSRRSRKSRSRSKSRSSSRRSNSKPRRSSSRRSNRSKRTPDVTRRRSKSWSLPKGEDKRDSWSRSPEKKN